MGSKCRKRGILVQIKQLFAINRMAIILGTHIFLHLERQNQFLEKKINCPSFHGNLAPSF